MVFDGEVVRESHGVRLPVIAQGGDGRGGGVANQRTGVIDVEGVAAEVAGDTQIDRAAGDIDGDLIKAAGGFLDVAGAHRQRTGALDQHRRIISVNGEGHAADADRAGADRQRGRATVDYHCPANGPEREVLVNRDAAIISGGHVYGVAGHRTSDRRL